MNNYEQGIARLIKRVRELDQPWSPTPLRNEILDVAKRLEALVQLLEVNGSAQFDIECEHDKEPDPETGVDGYRIPVPDFRCGYQPTLGYMRDLADSARRAASSLPGSREKAALPFAAMGLLHLRYAHGFDAPRISDSSADVEELDRVCKGAGLYKARETLRNSLSEALKIFDRHYMPYHFRFIVEGG